MKKLATVLISLVTAAGLGVSLGAAPAQAADAQRNPVVFVHGFSGAGWNFDSYRTQFLADGYSSSQLYTFEYDWSRGNASTAGKLNTFIDNVRAQTGSAKVDIVSHSMGALSTRYYLKNLGGLAEVDDFVSVAGPNHGTNFAYGCWWAMTSCAEMLPGSSYLNALNAGDPTPGAVNYTMIASPCDEIIIPNNSTFLNGATNIWAPCNGHNTLLVDPRVQDTVFTAVN